MVSEFSLRPVVEVDEKLCVNCHMCISVCPVKYCNDGSGDVVNVNPNTCIGCGKCIEACTHHARYYLDDFEKFTNDLIVGEKIIAVSAPATAASFPDAHLKLNSFLKELGVSAVFDVSFGAELTVKSYLEYIEYEKPKTVIAQPCPAIVSYIELYKPELIKYLAPADSPILHTIKMIKKFYNHYADYKIAIVSPCIAKRREYDETGLGDYNLAIQSIDKFIQANDVDLKSYPDSDFDNPPAERAVLFSSPGGLTKTIERWIPDISCQTRKIEGVEYIYEYLDKLPEVIEAGMAPLIIDCLSCENGCNQGPATLTKEQSPDETEYWVKKRAKQMKELYLEENESDVQKSKKSIEAIIGRYWNSELYERKYVNRWENVDISYPSKDEVERLYFKMNKFGEEDILNCSSCGYNSCENMAIAIHNGLNKPENCHHYLKRQTDINLADAEAEREKIAAMLQTAQDGFIEIDEDENIVSTNDSMRRILKRKDIVGKNIFEFIDKRYQKEIDQESKMRKKGKHSTYEIEFNQSDGRKVCCLVSASPMYDFKTRTITGSFAMVTDISKLKEIERQLRKANESLEQKVLDRTAKLNESLEELKQQREEILSQRDALAESEQKIHHILQILPDAALVIDDKGYVTFWNQAMENLTGISAKEMIGKGNYQYSVPFYGEARPILIDLVRIEDDVLNENYSKIEKRGNVIKAEAFINDLNGQQRYIIGTATAVYDSSGEYIGAMEIIHDITTIRSYLKEIEEQKKHITDSIQYAKKIQKAVLPSNDLLQEILSEHFVFFRPRDIISGDFHWIKQIKNKIYIAVADCTGHGVPGAFVSMLGISFLNEIVSKNNKLQPSDILDKLRAKIKSSLNQKGGRDDNKDGMDMALYSINTDTNLLHYAGAYNPLHIIRDGELINVKPDLQPVSVHIAEKPFTNNEVQLEKDDQIYTFSDGFVDQFGGKNGTKFYSKNFKNLLLSIHHKSMEDQKEILEQTFDEWRGNYNQLDDVLIMGVKI